MRDSDRDRMPNRWEEATGLNPYRANATGDPDQDHLRNFAEYTHGTLPLQPDTDGDGLNDGVEIHTYASDPVATDTDGDSLSDGTEVLDYSTDPTKTDSDSDDLSDPEELFTYLTDATRDNRTIHGSVTNLAHRGASFYAPENTLASFDLGVKLGADLLELDVFETSDGTLVVMHDPTLDRTARGPQASCTGTISSKTFAQVEACDVGSWFNDAHPEYSNPAYSQLRIPTLDEVFQRYGPKIHYQVELKVGGIETQALDSIARFDEHANVIISSFDSGVLKKLRSLDSSIGLVQIYGDSTSQTIQNEMASTSAYATHIAVWHEDIDDALIAAAHSRGLAVEGWTVDDPQRMEQLWRLGVDGIVTDLPNRMNVLAESPPT
jgi:glycerophosphoryl diester phosphodiesterase